MYLRTIETEEQAMWDAELYELSARLEFNLKWMQQMTYVDSIEVGLNLSSRATDLGDISWKIHCVTDARVYKGFIIARTRSLEIFHRRRYKIHIW